MNKHHMLLYLVFFMPWFGLYGKQSPLTKVEIQKRFAQEKYNQYPEGKVNLNSILGGVLQILGGAKVSTFFADYFTHLFVHRFSNPFFLEYMFFTSSVFVGTVAIVLGFDRIARGVYYKDYLKKRCEKLERMERKLKK